MICLFCSHTASLKLPPASLTTLPLLTFENAVPQAARFGAQSSHVRGAIELLDVSGEAVGFCFQTSPVSDTVIGFSGSSNLLIICDISKTICGIELLSSGDTRDHVSVVRNDNAFWSQFIGKTLEELKQMPNQPYLTTAGATLTSLAMIEALNEAIISNVISNNDLDAFVNMYLYSIEKWKEEPSSVAEYLCKYEALGEVELINTWSNKYKALTLEGCKNEAKATLSADKMSTIYYSPKK